MECEGGVEEAAEDGEVRAVSNGKRINEIQLPVVNDADIGSVGSWLSLMKVGLSLSGGWGY
jgi:hypothetical protein